MLEKRKHYKIRAKTWFWDSLAVLRHKSVFKHQAYQTSKFVTIMLLTKCL